MLESLTIRNFGIIEHVSLELTPQLNILTGETGAGKSILIDALRFCLGERFQSSYLRNDGNPCTVEAIFHISPDLNRQLHCLEDFPSDGNSLVIQRTVLPDGRNRIKLNGLTATVLQLKEIGDALIDFHGPHDHQQLLSEHRHMEILDTLTHTSPDTRDEYAALYKQYMHTRKQIESLQESAKTRERDIDLLNHQIKELEQVPLDAAHHVHIQQECTKIANAQKLFENISQALAILEDDHVGINQSLRKIFKPLQTLVEIDKTTSAFMDKLSDIQDQASTLASLLQDYSESLSFDPHIARQTNQQLDAYQDIQRKYGPTLDDAQHFFNEARKKADLLNNFEHNTQQLSHEAGQLESALIKLASNITACRQDAASELKKTIENELRQLGFKSIEFEVRLEKKPLSIDGTDTAAFFISTNAGEPLKPLAQIVSSGEAARIMLAVKRALMKVDPVPVLIFDEIDAQIGGRLGTTIGTKLQEIARHRQVILITHLPQIAAFAQTHLSVNKAVENNHTRIQVRILTGNNRVNELAHMMTGDSITAASLAHAKEMIKGAAA